MNIDYSTAIKWSDWFAAPVCIAVSTPSCCCFFLNSHINLLLGIRKRTMPHVASCARIRHFADIITCTPCCTLHDPVTTPRMHKGWIGPPGCTRGGLGPSDAHGVDWAPRMHTGWIGAPGCTRGGLGPPDAHEVDWAPRMHTGWIGPPGCTRGGLSPPDAHVVIIFASKPVARRKTELLELRKAIGIQANDLSFYNSFQRISHGCHGRAEPERGAMLLETCVLYRSIVPSVSSPRISAYRAAAQTLLTWEL